MMKSTKANAFLRFYAASTGTGQVLTLSCLFCCSLFAVRFLYTGHRLFAFLIWNLFLAFVPYALSAWMVRRASHLQRSFIIWPVFIWTLLIPNSFYLLTDLFHLNRYGTMPLWFDLALLLSFAWTGLLFGLLSVRHIEQLLSPWLGRRSQLFFVLPVMTLIGLGIYIGRYKRLNSWDVVAHPFSLAQDMLNLLVHPLRSRFDWSMIICYAILMTLIYMAMKKTSTEFHEKGDALASPF